MHRPTSFLALTALTITLASCYTPPQQPRPFARPGARSLDNPPRYGENRYGEQGGRGQGYVNDPTIDPRNLPPGYNTTPPPGLGGPVDQGMRPDLPGGVGTPPSQPVTPPPATGPATPQAPQVSNTTPPSAPATPPTQPAAAAPGDVPYARPVPGKPGYVFSPHDGKIIDVTGIRPGTKVKDPQSGAMFRVP